MIRLLIQIGTPFTHIYCRSQPNTIQYKPNQTDSNSIFPGNYGINAKWASMPFREIAVYSNNCNWFNQAIDLSIVGYNQWFQTTINRQNCTREYHLSGSICIWIFTFIYMQNVQVIAICKAYIVVYTFRSMLEANEKRFE